MKKMLLFLALMCVAPSINSRQPSYDQQKLNQKLFDVIEREGSSERILGLIKNGANVNMRSSNGFTPLHIAAKKGYLDICKLLLKNGAKVNMRKGRKCPRVRCFQGPALLFYAAANGHLEICKLLLENGAHVDTSGLLCGTPLLAAVKKGYTEIVKLLLENGADVKAKDSIHNGRTSLHYASRKGLLEIVKLLIAYGAYTDAETDRGCFGIATSMPLHEAAEWGHLEICRLLIEKGAAINALDNNGNTPLSLAKHYGHTEIYQLLHENNAEDSKSVKFRKFVEAIRNRPINTDKR